jgi:hypothetical protein
LKTKINFCFYLKCVHALFKWLNNERKVFFWKYPITQMLALAVFTLCSWWDKKRQKAKKKESSEARPSKGSSTVSRENEVGAAVRSGGGRGGVRGFDERRGAAGRKAPRAKGRKEPEKRRVRILFLPLPYYFRDYYGDIFLARVRKRTYTRSLLV